MTEEGFTSPRGFASKFQVYLGALQLIPNAVNTQINFGAVQFDDLNEYDEVVAYQFQPLQAGYYYFEAGLQFAGMVGGVNYAIFLMVNLATINLQFRVTVGGVVPMAYVTRFWYLIPTDVVWVQAYQASGGGVNLNVANVSTWFEGFRVA